MAIKATADMEVGRFIAGIGALIRDPSTGRYLFLQRAAEKDFSAEAWECVTGRVNQGEGFEQALHREVLEEIGIPVQIDFIIGTSHFYRGTPRPENELLGIIYRCSSLNSTDLHLSGEHRQFQWLTYAQALHHFSGNPANSWLVRTVEWAETMHRLLPDELVAAFHKRGFDINHQP